MLACKGFEPQYGGHENELAVKQGLVVQPPAYELAEDPSGRYLWCRSTATKVVLGLALVLHLRAFPARAKCCSLTVLYRHPLLLCRVLQSSTVCVESKACHY